MEIFAIPFEREFIIYRPLLQLAFIGNQALVNYIQKQSDGQPKESDKRIDGFLESIGFWRPDPLPPDAPVPVEKYSPTMAVLHMTNACNLRCTYCYARGGEQSDLWMSMPLARIAIDTVCVNAKAAGRDWFALAFHGGGEPTLNWKILTESVRYAEKKELKPHISMSSNGLWDQQQRQFIIEHFSELSISFDGIREIQDNQRPKVNGRGSFDDVMKTIHDLDEAQFRYGIRLTVTGRSFKSLPESISFLCANTRCQIIQVEPCYSTERGEYAGPVSEQGDMFTQAFMESFKIAASAGRIFFYSGARPWVLSNCFCRAAEDALIVTPEGDVVNCFEIYDRRHPLITDSVIGKVLPERGIVEWNSDQKRAISNQQELRRQDCDGCFCYYHCGGDCASKCLSSKDNNRSRCDVNRTITRELLAWYIAQGNGVWSGAAQDDVS